MCLCMCQKERVTFSHGACWPSLAWLAGCSFCSPVPSDNLLKLVANNFLWQRSQAKPNPRRRKNAMKGEKRKEKEFNVKRRRSCGDAFSTMYFFHNTGAVAFVEQSLRIRFMWKMAIVNEDIYLAMAARSTSARK